MVNEFKSDFIKFTILLGIFTIIAALWQLCDIIQFGKPMPSVSDTIIGTVLTFSIYKNLHIKVLPEVKESEQA